MDVSGVLSSWLTERRNACSVSCALVSLAFMSLNETASSRSSRGPSRRHGDAGFAFGEPAARLRQPAHGAHDAAREQPRAEQAEDDDERHARTTPIQKSRSTGAGAENEAPPTTGIARQTGT